MMQDRSPERPRIGLAMGGGAARGIAHIGVMRVLAAEGIRPHVITGTSAGALAGVFLAAGFSVERIQAWAACLRWPRLARPAVSRLGLVSSEPLVRLLRRTLPVRSFDELRVPFACVATDVETASAVVLRSGDLPSAVQASCAIPGLVTPVERDGRLLMDGGVSNNVPAAVARELGADIVVAVDVNGRFRAARPPNHMIGVLVQAYFSMGRLAQREIGVHADILISPEVGDVRLDELHRGAELIRAGEAAARAVLPALRQRIELWPAEPPASVITEAAA